MNCPKCRGVMAPIGTSEGVELDFCSSCKGILFDAGEVAEYFEMAQDIPDLQQDMQQALPTSFHCPKCRKPFVSMPFTPKSNLLIDRCSGCAAIFLDKGEFPKLQALASALAKPKSRILMAVQTIHNKGYEIVGIKK